MTLSKKLALNKKLKSKVADVTCAIDNIGTQCGKASVQRYTSSLENHVTFSGNSPFSNSQQGLMGSKRKISGGFLDGEFLVTQMSKPLATNIAFSGKSQKRLRDQNTKGEKMDATKMRQCASLLKELMTHKDGWVFNQPVDPVRLEIPDYFSIISRPMDLGTVKNNLDSMIYSNTHQFVSDVSLTFSNAMQYNPPVNPVHVMAKELHEIFNSRWKLLEISWRRDCATTVQQSGVKTQKQAVSSKQALKTQKPVVTSKQVHLVEKTPTLFSRRTLTSSEKLNLRKYLAELSLKNIPPRLLGFLQEAVLFGENKGKLDLDIDVLDKETLWKLHQNVKTCLDGSYTECTTTGKTSEPGLVQNSCNGSKGTIFRQKIANKKSLTSHATDIDCRRSSGIESYSHRSIATDKEIRKPTARTQRSELNSSQEIRNPTASSQRSELNSSFNDEHNPSCDQQLSPTKALRAATLRSRFADTIVKAQHKTLLNHGEKEDLLMLQREKQRLERKQQEEMSRIEAQVKAVKEAAQRKAEAEMMQREKERKAARLALQKIEKTVDIDENSQALKDLEHLSSVAYARPGNHSHVPHGNPLERLGLFMKNDDMDEGEDWLLPPCRDDLEEGEIL